MNSRLGLKILLVYLIFALCSFVFLAVSGESLFRKSARRSASENLYQEAVRLAARQKEFYLLNQQIATEELDGSAGLYRILVLDAAKTVIYDSDNNQLTGRLIQGFFPSQTSGRSLEGNFYGCFEGDNLSAYFPISVNEEVVAYMTVHQNISWADAWANSFIREAFWIYDIILLFYIITVVTVIIWVIRPIKTITEGAKAYAVGRLDYRIKLKSRDEIGYLADSLNEMAGRLQETDDIQRKFIANVSHDFRSPLTSIHGYVQAMADGVIPPESQEKYLKIIMTETTRLTNLTQTLLSLNSLNGGQGSLALSDFDMLEMVHSICDTFEGICKEKDITFDILNSAPPILVHADPARINQVIHNLLDNAIKFSDKHSHIRILVQIIGKKAYIAIKDYGCGIRKEELSQIWNRFYKSDASRGINKKGTGLGLAIIREIITAHGETIDVTSTPGSGTEFSFRLPLAKGDKI